MARRRRRRGFVFAFTTRNTTVFIRDHSVSAIGVLVSSPRLTPSSDFVALYTTLRRKVGMLTYRTLDCISRLYSTTSI